MADVVMPGAGMAMTEGVLLQWLKQPGESVAKGEVVAEIETDKSTAEVESPAEGVLGEHRFTEGDAVEVGAVLVEVREAGDVPAVSSDVAPTQGPRLSPRERARQQAAEQQQSSASTAGASRNSSASGNDAVDEPGYRDAIAKGVSASWQEIPHFSVTRDTDGARLQPSVKALRQQGISVSVTDVLLRAIAEGMRGRTAFDGNIGLAVATARGVVIGVLEGVAELSWSELAASREQVVSRAVAGQLSRADLQVRPLITLSNLGSREVDHFTGIIPLGQQLLLTAGRIREVAVSEGGQLTSGWRIFLTMNADHRNFDGADVAELLSAIGGAVEHPHSATETETR